MRPLPRHVSIILGSENSGLIRCGTHNGFGRLIVSCHRCPGITKHATVCNGRLPGLVKTRLTSSARVISLSLSALRFCITPSRKIGIPMHIGNHIRTSKRRKVRHVDIIPSDIAMCTPSSCASSLGTMCAPRIRCMKLASSIDRALALNTHHNIGCIPTRIRLRITIDPCIAGSMSIPVDNCLFPCNISLGAFPSGTGIAFHVDLRSCDVIARGSFRLRVRCARVRSGPSKGIVPHLIARSSGMCGMGMRPTRISCLLRIGTLPRLDGP